MICNYFLIFTAITPDIEPQNAPIITSTSNFHPKENVPASNEKTKNVTTTAIAPDIAPFKSPFSSLTATKTPSKTDVILKTITTGTIQDDGSENNLIITAKIKDSASEVIKAIQTDFEI